VIGELNTQLSWYAARASGLVAWALVTASIVWGLALSTRIVRRRGASAWLLDLHKFLGTLSLVFVGVHLLALWADNYVYFGPRELFVPMGSEWPTGCVFVAALLGFRLVARRRARSVKGSIREPGAFQRRLPDAGLRPVAHTVGEDLLEPRDLRLAELDAVRAGVDRL
jgi:hypothetical protein